MSKIDELIATTKLNDLINKKEEEKASKTVLWILAVIGAVAAVAAIAYAVYCFFTPDYLEDFEQHSLLIICTFNCNRYMGSDYRYLVRNGVSNECSVPESTGNSKLCKLSGLLRSYSSCTAEHDYEVLILCRSNSDGAW